MNDNMIQLLKQTEEWIESHKSEFLAELQGMTRIPSVSREDLAEPGAPFGPDCRRMLDYALERGRYYGFETMDHEGYAGSICLGDPDNAIGIFTHLDVVPVDDGWLYPPYEATYLPEYDAIVGRGCDDNKSAVVAILFVLRMLKEFGCPLRHGVRMFCGVSEETGMQDMIALKEKGMRFPQLSLVPDSGFPVNYGQKGMVIGDISTECKGNLLSFDAGTAHNVVPDYAECVIALDEAKVMEVLNKIEPELAQEITVKACPEGTMLTALGKSAHTAAPEKGKNAIAALTQALVASNLLEGSCADAIRQLCELSSDFTGKNEGISYSDEMSGNLSVVYSVAHLKDGKLTITMDSRTPITCNVEELVEKLTSAWTSRGFDVVETSLSKPYYIPVDDPYVVALQDVFHDITGSERQPFVMGGGNYARVIPNAYSYGPGMPTKIKVADFMPEGHGNCHGKDEAVVLEKLYNCAKIYVLSIVALDAML